MTWNGEPDTLDLPEGLPGGDQRGLRDEQRQRLGRAARR